MENRTHQVLLALEKSLFLSFELKDRMPFIVKGMIPVDFDSIEPRESKSSTFEKPRSA